MFSPRTLLGLALTGLLSVSAVQAQSNESLSKWLKFRSANAQPLEAEQAAEAREEAAEVPLAKAQASGPNSPERRIVGSFRATFTSAETPASFPPLPALFTFHQGGTFIETDGGGLATTPPPDPLFGSPGHGVWESLDHLRYRVKFALLVVNQDGTLALRGTVRLRIRLSDDGQTFEGEGTFRFVDADGNPIPGGTGPEKVSGRRIEIE